MGLLIRIDLIAIGVLIVLVHILELNLQNWSTGKLKGGVDVN